MKKWIKVKEELPESGVCVLVWFEGGYRAEIGRWFALQGVWFDDFEGYELNQSVTHWQPLPRGPEEE